MKFYNLFLIACFLMTNQLHARKYEYIGHCTSKIEWNEFDQCLKEELAKLDKELNDLYKSFFNSAHFKDLKNVEKLWIKYKNADCHYMANEVNGGLQYQHIYKACLINKTKTRVAELKRSYLYGGWFEQKHR